MLIVQGRSAHQRHGHQYAHRQAERYASGRASFKSVTLKQGDDKRTLVFARTVPVRRASRCPCCRMDAFGSSAVESAWRSGPWPFGTSLDPGGSATVAMVDGVLPDDLTGSRARHRATKHPVILKLNKGAEISLSLGASQVWRIPTAVEGGHGIAEVKELASGTTSRTRSARLRKFGLPKCPSISTRRA